jgi:hypothetical protein
MNREYIDKFIKLFEEVLSCPIMYFGKYDTDAVVLSTQGLYMSLSITNHSFPNEKIYREVSKNRGWHFNALGIIPDMKAKGLSNEEMVKELVSVEIEAWKIFRDGLEK